MCYTGEKERFAPRQYREDTGMEYEIDEVRKISIGGVGQKIHIRGEKRTNPVLLFLHGGPGISNRDSVVNREKDLCDVITIVAWDQRGRWRHTGRSRCTLR